MQKLQFKSHFSTFFATCRFLQKYNPPDASNFGKKIYEPIFYPTSLK